MDINNLKRSEFKKMAESKVIDGVENMANFLKEMDINKLDFSNEGHQTVSEDATIYYEYILIYTNDTSIVHIPGDEYVFKYKGHPMDVKFITYAKVNTHTTSEVDTDTRTYNGEEDKGMLYFAYDFKHMQKQKEFPYTLFRANPNFEYELIMMYDVEVINKNTDSKINDIYKISF